MKPMDFFVWQDAGEVNSRAIHDECNAARRKKTRFHGTLWVGIGISPVGTNGRGWRYMQQVAKSRPGIP
jgi:hypothetical protein